MEKIHIKKHYNKEFNYEHLVTLTKEELIETIKSLQAHNLQLKNILSRTVSTPHPHKKPRKPFDFDSCTFRHVLLKVIYLGWNYHGYATQEDSANTIEHHLFEALTKTCLIKDRTCSNYHRCGRTDKGVSSFGQVISIDLRSRLSSDDQGDLVNEIEYCKILNNVLPENIQCVAWCPVNANFSARFDCTSRMYKYFFPKGNLDMEKMQTASNYLVGIHDFRNFCKMDVGNGVVQFIRSITSIEISHCYSEGKLNNDEYGMYVIIIKGQAFLWHQIRCIMGILFLIGENREQPEIVKELLDVNTNSRKPDYNMACELPLNLYFCEYDTEENWYYDSKSLRVVMERLQKMWTRSAVKATMIEHMLHELNSTWRSLEETQNDRSDTLSTLTSCLLNGVKAKRYIPLLERKKCESLDDRIKHFMKKRKLEIQSQNSNT